MELKIKIERPSREVKRASFYKAYMDIECIKRMITSDNDERCDKLLKVTRRQMQLNLLNGRAGCMQKHLKAL